MAACNLWILPLPACEQPLLLHCWPLSRQLVSGIPANTGWWDFPLLPDDCVCLVFPTIQMTPLGKPPPAFSPSPSPGSPMCVLLVELSKAKDWGGETKCFTPRTETGVSSVPGLIVNRVQVCLDLKVSGTCRGYEGCFPHVESGVVAEWFLKAPLGSDTCF